MRSATSPAAWAISLLPMKQKGRRRQSLSHRAYGCPYQLQGSGQTGDRQISAFFVGDATEAEILSDGQVQTLDDFTGAGAATPVTATVFRTLEADYGWKCTICGYIYEGEEVPDDYQCPICRAPKSKFVKR